MAGLHSAVALYAAALCILSLSVYQHVPEPYMDEPFHINQTQLFCHGNFSYWDPKITTLPGLYVAGLAQAWLSALQLHLIGHPEPMEASCSVAPLRAVNLVMAVACMYVIHSIIVRQQKQQGAQGSEDSISTGSTATGGKQQQADAGRAQSSKSKQSHLWAPKGLRPGGRAAASIRPTLWTVALCLMPLHWSYTYLYYTDIGSTLFILLCYLEAHRGHHLLSGLSAVAAVLFRQTNAVWVGFIAGSVALQHVHGRVQARIAKLRRKQQEKHQRTIAGSSAQHYEGSTSDSKPQEPPPSSQQLLAATQAQQQPLWQQVFEELCQTVYVVWQERVQLLYQLWPLLGVVLAFAGFVAINKGITVGDRAAHQPVLHAAQFLVYFPLFTAAMLGPQLLDTALRSLSSLQRRQRTLMLVAAAGAAAGVAGLVLSPPPHPYLLADNRHLTFYLWRRLLARSKALTYGVVAPVAGGVAWPLILWALLQRQDWLWVVGFLVCTAVVLVPAWLLEFRYFTTPLMMIALHLPMPRLAPLLVILVLYLAVDAGTLYLFLEKPFSWADGSVARFMW